MNFTSYLKLGASLYKNLIPNFPRYPETHRKARTPVFPLCFPSWKSGAWESRAAERAVTTCCLPVCSLFYQGVYREGGVGSRCPYVCQKPYKSLVAVRSLWNGKQLEDLKKNPRMATIKEFGWYAPGSRVLAHHTGTGLGSLGKVWRGQGGGKEHTAHRTSGIFWSHPFPSGQIKLTCRQKRFEA